VIAWVIGILERDQPDGFARRGAKLVFRANPESITSTTSLRNIREKSDDSAVAIDRLVGKRDYAVGESTLPPSRLHDDRYERRLDCRKCVARRIADVNFMRNRESSIPAPLVSHQQRVPSIEHVTRRTAPSEI
jgi:hypothetical protein